MCTLELLLVRAFLPSWSDPCSYFPCFGPTSELCHFNRVVSEWVRFSFLLVTLQDHLFSIVITHETWIVVYEILIPHMCNRFVLHSTSYQFTAEKYVVKTHSPPLPMGARPLVMIRMVSKIVDTYLMAHEIATLLQLNRSRAIQCLRPAQRTP